MRRVLASLRFQTHPIIEVVVVSDQIDLKFAMDVIDISLVKHVHFDQANISHARNLGIQVSSGELIAFVDDDAVPEPRWSARLANVFANKTVGIAGGIVRGRNGLSVQWAAMEASSSGASFPIDYVLDDPIVLTASPDRLPALVGTNVAFRRDALISLGGFDTDFEFFLDETDMCLRMGKRGWKTCFVPLAEVQHGYEESKERASNRVPKTLFNLGRSKALFLRKHAKPIDWPSGRESFEIEQRARLLRYLNLGLLGAFEFQDLISSLTKGFEQGLSVSTSGNMGLRSNKVDFLKFTQANPVKHGVAIAGYPHQRTELDRRAVKLSKQGVVTNVFRLSRTTLFHKRYFDVSGFWVQTGGVFGRADRDQPVFQITSLKQRVTSEVKTLDKQRSIKDIVFV